MTFIVQGTATTATVHEGAIGAKNALIIPFENSANPAAYISSYPDLRLIRVNSDNNQIEWWNGTEWTDILGSYGVIQFRVGDPLFPSPDYPSDGDVNFTDENFEGKTLTILPNLLGSDLIYGIDYIRTDGLGGSENPLGDTVLLQNGYEFSNGSTWSFYKGQAVQNSEEILNAAKSFALMLFNSVVGGIGVATPTSSPQAGVQIYRAYVLGEYENFEEASGIPIEVLSGDLTNGYVELVKNPDTGFYEKKIPVIPPVSIQVTATNKTITDSRLIGRTVTVVFISNNTPKQTGFDKPLGSDTLTFTDSTNNGSGKTVTILLG